MSAKRPQVAAVLHGRYGRAARIIPIWETTRQRWMKRLREFFSGFVQPFVTLY